ncbi:dynein regulatory complex subunit 4-like [Genypterus blacodes]|uniref:dynein regulatory complex subunit 4-like n=1 Tax=Genypterus blacodes TaxID=154954 RepID=UPI003F75B5F6
MPPKSKRRNKKAVNGKTAVVDGQSTEEMTKEQLEEHIIRLREELDREREERSYFQLERDKIHSFWEISKRTLTETKAGQRNRQREREEAEGRHRAAINLYKQKLKHVLSEQHDSVSELKTAGVVSSVLLQRECAKSESQLHTELHSRKVDVRHNKLSKENTVQEHKLKHEEELSEIRKGFTRQLRDIELKSRSQRESLIKKEEQRRRSEMSGMEERQNNYVTTLLENNHRTLRDFQMHYSNIHPEFVKDFSSAEHSLAELEKEQKHVTKKLTAAVQEEKNLCDRVQKGQEQQHLIQQCFQKYEHDKKPLATSRASMKVGTQEDRELQVEIVLLQQAFKKVEQERDELQKNQMEVLLDLQQKCSLNSLLVDKKLEALTEVTESEGAQLYDVLSTSMEQMGLRGGTNRPQCVVDTKDMAIKDLQDELGQVMMVNNALLQSSKEKLRVLNQPEKDIRLQSTVAAKTCRS